MFFLHLPPDKRKRIEFLSADHEATGWLDLVPCSETTTPDLDLVTQALLHISCLLLPAAVVTKKGAECPVRQLFSNSQCSLSCCGLFIFSSFAHNYQISRLVWSFSPKFRTYQVFFPPITMKLLFLTGTNRHRTK